MTRLKYIDSKASRSEDPDGTDANALRFPGSVRDVLSRPDPRVMSHDDLVSSIEATLDRMQDALGALARESEGSMRFEDFRPSGPGPNSAA